MKSLLAFSFLTILIFAGCNSTPAPIAQDSKDKRPTWILNPNQDGKTGAVGIADVHIKGLSYQKALAASRARVELSQSQGVEVISDTNMKESYSSDGRSSSSINTNATFKSKSAVTAHIQEIWQDKMSEKIYIWMVLDN